jgi:hypothetical protein
MTTPFSSLLHATFSETEVVDLIASTPALGFMPKADLSVRRVTEVVDDAGTHES